jgi:hypothetical protein
MLPKRNSLAERVGAYSFDFYVLSKNNRKAHMYISHTKIEIFIDNFLLCYLTRRMFLSYFSAVNLHNSKLIVHMEITFYICIFWFSVPR